MRVGTKLRLIEAHEPVQPARPECERKPYMTVARPCGVCEHCTGLPAGSAFPWNEIEVCGAIDANEEVVVRPIVFSLLSSPRRVHVDDLLLDLYEIVTEGPEPLGYVDVEGVL